MSTYLRQTRALALAALLAVAVAFGLAFAAPSSAQADEGDLQAGALQTQATTLADGVYRLPNLEASSSMYNHFVADATTLTVSGDKATLSFTTDGSTDSMGKYTKIALGKSSELLPTTKQSGYADDLPAGTVIAEGTEAGMGEKSKKYSFEFVLSKADAEKLVGADGDPLYITMYNSSKPGWYRAKSDVYLQLGDYSEVAYDLTPTNNEKMFKVVKATLNYQPAGESSLTFWTSGSSYTYAYAGTQDEAVAAKDKKDTDKKWSAIGSKASFDPAVEYVVEGKTTTAKEGYPYTIPVTIDAGATSVSPNVVMLGAAEKTTGKETADNYHARNFAIDLTAKTLTVNNASDIATLTVKSEISDFTVKDAGSINYTGYVRPYAGTDLNAKSPLGNNWASGLTVNLGDNKTYDKAYAVKYADTPWVAEGTATVDPSNADYASVAENGDLTIPVNNSYNSKTTQLNGNLIKVMMHVSANADSPNKDQWVTRTFKLDFQSRTKATLTISDGGITPARLQGNIALDTMKAIVDEGWKGETGNTVVLTTVDGYWDALTAAGVAGMAGAPVLMTDGKTLSDQTKATITELAPTKVVVCGGTAAVTDEVAQAAVAVAAENAKLIRCAGATATSTAVDVFNKAKSEELGEWAAQAFVCTNDGYWDALAAAPISYAKRMPIFLTEGSSDISDETLNAMKDGGIKAVYIVGGEKAIEPAVAAKLEAANIEVAGRLAGDIAVATSEAVAEFGLAHDMTCANLGIATTNGYWDALAGAPLCGKNNGVIVLATDNTSTSISGFVSKHKADIAKCFVFGGEMAIDADTYAAIQAALA